MNSEEFPGLAAAMECEFGECDLAQGGGGLVAHPRLTDVHYRATDSATTIKEARRVEVHCGQRVVVKMPWTPGFSF